MKYVAKHYVKLPWRTVTPGEIFDGGRLGEQEKQRLLRLGAVEELAPLMVEEQEEDTLDNDTQLPDEGAETEQQDEAAEEEQADDEGAEEDDERDIDASEGLVAPKEEPAKPVKAPAKTGRKGK